MAFPSNLTKAKQVHKFFQAPMLITGLSFPAAATMDVSTALSTAASTASDSGGSVPHQVLAANAMGWPVTSPQNRVEIYNSTGDAKITSASNNEIYGRLTNAGAVYTLSLFEMKAGVETAYTMPSATTIQAEFNYRFSFEALPESAMIGYTIKHVGQDASSGLRIKQERLTVTGVNTLSALSSTPSGGTALMMLVVNGKTETNLGAAVFTTAGTTVTWSATNAGYALDTTDIVDAIYAY